MHLYTSIETGEQIEVPVISCHGGGPTTLSKFCDMQISKRARSQIETGQQIQAPVISYRERAYTLEGLRVVEISYRASSQMGVLLHDPTTGNKIIVRVNPSDAALIQANKTGTFTLKSDPEQVVGHHESRGEV